jgi:hypothetical protein
MSPPSPSIADRVDTSVRKLQLLSKLLNAGLDELTPCTGPRSVDSDDLSALGDILRELAEVLDPIADAPESIRAWVPPPTRFERAEQIDPQTAAEIVADIDAIDADRPAVEVKPKRTLNIGERDAVDAAKTRLRGCIRLLDDLVERTDFASPDAVDGYDVIIDNMRDAVETLDCVFETADARDAKESRGRPAE